MVTDRLQPYDNDAEESVIGSILIDGDSITSVSAFLKSEDFYVQRNRKCYDACVALLERGEAINQVTVARKLADTEDLESVGGAPYLGHLVSNVPTSVHIEHYGRIVRRMSVFRKIIRAGGEIADLGYVGGPDSDDVLAKAEEVLYGIQRGRGERDFAHLRVFLDQYMEQSGALQDLSSVALAPIITGFPSMDELLGGGLQRSDLVILAARPSLGKSALALNMARNAAVEGYTAGIFSLEMSGEQIAVRLLASEAEIDSHRLRMNLLRDEEEHTVLDAIGLLSDLPIYIDETPFQTVMEIRNKSRRLQQERGLDLLVVDYLQLIDTGQKRQPRRRSRRGIPRSQGTRPRTRHSRTRLLPVKPRRRAAAQPPPAALRPPRVRQHRAGRRRRSLHPPRRPVRHPRRLGAKVPLRKLP